MQRVTVRYGTVVDGRTGESYAADGDSEGVLTDSQVDYLGDQVRTIEHVDPGADTDADGVPDADGVGFSAVAFVDRDYQIVEDAIRRGDADDHLAAVWEADADVRDGRVTIQEALLDRGYEPTDEQREAAGLAEGGGS